MPRIRVPLGFTLLAACIILVVYLSGAPTSTSLSIYNTGWNGLSELNEDLQPGILSNITQVGNLDPHDTVVIAALTRPLNTLEVDELIDYVSRGGVTVILDDSGYSNIILEALGSGCRVWGGAAILDGVYRLGSSYHPLAYWEGGYSVALDAPRPINASEGCGAKALLVTSPYSFIDSDHNGYYTPGEERGPHIVGVRLSVGEGALVIVGDTGIVMNQLYTRNAGFIRELIGDRTPYLDQSSQLGHFMDYIKYKIREAEAPGALALALLAAASVVSAYAARTG